MSRILLPLALSSIVVGVLLSSAAAAHPFHTSTLEADWLADEGKLQASLRVDPAALNAALRLQTGAPLTLAPLEGPRADLAAFLNKNIQVGNAANKALPLTYRGHQVDKDGVWLFFEVALPGGVSQTRIESTLFFDLEPRQMNAVVVRAGEDLLLSSVLLRARPAAVIP